MIRLLIGVALAAGLLQAQFIDVTCDLKVEQLKESDRQALPGLNEAVVAFFTSSAWEQEISDLDMSLDIQMVFLPSITLGGDRYYQAQILFTNRQDQLYFVKDAKFLYSPGRSLALSSVFDPLATLLEFYAYLLIASELDTYAQLGGSAYYSKASALAQLSQSAPQLGRSWGNRIKLVEQYATNQDLRRAKAYFFAGFDALGAEEPDMVALKEALTLFHQSLERVFLRSGIERQTTIFLSGHAEEIGEMLAMTGMWAELQGMIQYNPDSERIYGEFLKDRP